VATRRYLTLDDTVELTQALGGEEAYPTLAGKAGALMHSLAGNHALTDGNNRLRLPGQPRSPYGSTDSCRTWPATTPST
jgi:hypothetical protein